MKKKEKLFPEVNYQLKNLKGIMGILQNIKDIKKSYTTILSFFKAFVLLIYSGKCAKFHFS